MAGTDRQESLGNPDVASLLAHAQKPSEEALRLHPQYRGKLEVVPKCSIQGCDDFAIWYTPGVAAPCRDIAAHPERVYSHTNKGNFVAVVSDGTRVLGLGDVGPHAALPVMEGKALLFKYLGAVDALPICLATKDPEEIIQACKWLEPTFGAINLEDIANPKCFYILDRLRQELTIPVWHDDQQGTAAVTLAGLINALKLVGKPIDAARVVLIGAGAANIAVMRLLANAGFPEGELLMVDSRGILHRGRDDLRTAQNPYKWRVCERTNYTQKTGDIADALKGADVCIAIAKSGPGVIRSEWISTMAEDAIVFACANPVPEIWPWEAQAAGARIVATGRSDFPNQVNNSLGFPGIFRGVLDVGATTISDEMCIAAAQELANCATVKGLAENHILPTMDEWEVFPRVAAAVGVKAIEQGLARTPLSRAELIDNASKMIRRAQNKPKCSCRKVSLRRRRSRLRGSVMPFAAIKKDQNSFKVSPHLVDYQRTCKEFSWQQAERELSGSAAGAGLNIAYQAVDRHAEGPRALHLALRWLGKQGDVVDYTYADLRRLTNRFANALRCLGIGKGDRVFALAGRIPELYIAALGTLKNGSVFCPLFSAFGPEPIHQRLAIGEGDVLVTTEALYQRRKIADLRASLPALKHVLVIGPGDFSPPADTVDFHQLLHGASEDFTTPVTDPQDMALIHFTSGTTGKPKGAVHVHQAVVAHHSTGKYALDLHPNDVFWCTADPGWVTGTSYGIIAPLTHGITSIVDEADFDAERWYRVIQGQKVTVWYTAPTAVRMMMKAGTEIIGKYDLSSLRFISSVGEPLNPEAVVWGQGAFGMPIHDNWWQTETGGIMIANYLAMEIRPGSMGRPLPGIEAAIVHKQKDGTIVEAKTDEVGELALKPGWPSMFRAYLHEEERYRKCFAGGWYLTGDLAKQDGDGYFWFIGRADDVIKSAGHLIGPFEVESALMEHPAIAEAGVIGKPDAMIGEVVKAFVALKKAFEPSDALRKELLGHARSRLGPAVAPREIEFLDSVPKTRSGKIMRRLLKARELGLPEGDLSTLEND